jgi:RHS repeat-associated protein
MPAACEFASNRPHPRGMALLGDSVKASSGRSYYRARYYDASAGRFTSEDPIRSRGGIDFYTYTANSPTNLTDPSGLCPPANGCPAPNTKNPKPLSSCSIYPDLKHRLACKELAGDDPVGQCVRGCLQDQYDTSKHAYKCDESKLHCSCFDACGFSTGFLANRARNHFDCGGHADAPLPPM